MSRFKCSGCGEVFDESDAGSRSYCYEESLGLRGCFSVCGVNPQHYGSYMVCPECGSENYDYYYDDEEEYEDE